VRPWSAVNQDLALEVLEHLSELAVDLDQRLPRAVAREPERVPELVDGRVHGEDDLSPLGERPPELP
jgi:hypothetical protein